ncbi:MAG: hydrogenase [Campylobacterales bacterium]|nr:hydrogenase [Campylobacterales bacterium]
MAIKQTIKYNSENQYFGGFLQSLINESGVKGNVSFTGTSYEMVLDESNQEALQTFGEITQKYLPHSVFLGEISTSKDDSKIGKPFSSKDYDISLCPKCVELVANPSSDRYLDDNLVCNHYSNQGERFVDNTIFSPNYSEGDSVLLVDSKAIHKLFILTDDEVKALFSIEKPTLKVTIQDEILKDMVGKSFINIKAPYNMKSTLAGLNAKESDLEYLFFNDQSKRKAVVVKENVTFIHDNPVTKSLEKLDEDCEVSRFLNLSKEAGYDKGTIGASLSVESGINFLVSNAVGSKKVIKFQEFSLEKILEQFSKNDTKTRLLNNLEAKFPQIVKILNENGDFSLFQTIGAILELKEGTFESVSDKSYEFRGNGGLTIDTHFNIDGFDYGSFIGSIISFKLAGADEHYIAYSIFEAIGDLAITTMNQLKDEFKIDKFVMMGSMFENSVLYSRIVSKFQLSNPYFSKGIALDN